jgi:hypothetical protein
MAGQAGIRAQDTAIVPSVATVILFSSWIMACIAYRGLYADGANYFLWILSTGDFFHVADTRLSATYLTQLPLVLALKAGITSTSFLLRLYTASLMAVPLLAFVAATWIARRDGLLTAANVVVLAACFYPTSFGSIGEYHLLYALFWLTFVLLVTGVADRFLGAAALPAIALVVMKSYEMAVVLCPFLVALCLWRALRSDDPAARPVLLLTAYLFAFGAWFGLVGGVLIANSGADGFASALGRFFENQVLLQQLALATLAALAALVPYRAPRWAAALALVAGLAWFVYHQAQPGDELGLGVTTEQRAQVWLILLAVCLLLLIARATPLRNVAAHPLPAPMILVLPLLAAGTIDAIDTHDWRGYLDELCAELRGADGAAGSEDFFAGRRVRKMRYEWEYPTLSVLLRPPGSDRILLHPDYDGWLPFDPRTEVPDISAFRNDGICR